jgi:hypothetical protein
MGTSPKILKMAFAHYTEEIYVKISIEIAIASLKKKCHYKIAFIFF